MRPMVVAGDGQDAAMLVRATHVGAVEGVAAAVHARPLAVPHAVNALDPRAGEGIQFLRAVQHRGGEVLVDPGLEPYVVRRHQFLLRPQFPVQGPQRRAAIAGHQRRGVQPGREIESPLFQQQPQQRLDAGEQDRLIEVGKPRFQGNAAVSKTDIHGRSSLPGF
jgi:hypothetical protein